MSRSNTVERYAQAIELIQERLSEHSYEELKFADIAKDCKVGKQLLNVLIQHNYLDRSRNGFYRLTSNFESLTPEILAGLTKDYYTRKRKIQVSLNVMEDDDQFTSGVIGNPARQIEVFKVSKSKQVALVKKKAIELLNLINELD